MSWLVFVSCIRSYFALEWSYHRRPVSISDLNWVVSTLFEFIYRIKSLMEQPIIPHGKKGHRRQLFLFFIFVPIDVHLCLRCYWLTVQAEPCRHSVTDSVSAPGPTKLRWWQQQKNKEKEKTNKQKTTTNKRTNKQTSKQTNKKTKTKNNPPPKIYKKIYRRDMTLPLK